MNKLISLAKAALKHIEKDEQKVQLPFSVYSSFKEQHIFNVPIVKPLLIFVLDGEKRLGEKSDVICSVGQFIFLSNRPTIDMRNIPSQREYFALLIEFEYSDFDVLDGRPRVFDEPKLKLGPDNMEKYITGVIDNNFARILEQFIEWSIFAPTELWSTRRKEILQYIEYLGYAELYSLAQPPSFTHTLHELICENLAEDVSVAKLCQKLAMSESTLRRKLQAEDSSLQEIKDRARLGQGLHLLQTTVDSIGTIAAECGYQSQSRFTDKFKKQFGLTPSDLRKTRLNDSG